MPLQFSHKVQGRTGNVRA